MSPSTVVSSSSVRTTSVKETLLAFVINYVWVQGLPKADRAAAKTPSDTEQSQRQ